MVWKIQHSKKYLRSKINNIEIIDASQRIGAAGFEMFGLSHIYVGFTIGNKKKMIGKQINKEEAEIIIRELENKK